jgi:hypothetical protein
MKMTFFKVYGYAFFVGILSVSYLSTNPMELRGGKKIEKKPLVTNKQRAALRAAQLAATGTYVKDGRKYFPNSVVLPIPQPPAAPVVQRRPNVSAEKLAELREKAKRFKISGWANVVLFSPDLPLNIREAIIEDDKVQLVSREEWDRMVASDEEHDEKKEQRPCRIKPGYKHMMPEDAI